MSYQVVPIGASIAACGFMCSQGCIFKRSSLSLFLFIYFTEIYILFQHTVIDMSELGIVI